MNFFSIEKISKSIIIGVFILKIIAGITLWWLYTYKLPGSDMHDYFNDGNTLFHLLFHNPNLFFEIVFHHGNFSELRTWNNNFEGVLYNDAHTMVLLNVVFNFFSFGNFHVHTIFMCFLSLLGLVALYKTFNIYFETEKKLLFVILFLIPSVLLWSSGVLKEGLLFLGMGMFLYSTNCGLRKKYSWKQIVIAFFSITILLIVKIYILLALLPGILINSWISRTSIKLIWIKYFIVFCFLCCSIGIIKFINADYNPLQIIVDKQAKAISEAQGGVFLASNKYFVSIDYNKKDDYLQKIKDSVYTIKKGSAYWQWEFYNMKDTTFIKNATDTNKFELLYEVVPANTVVKTKRLKPNLFSLITNIPSSFTTVLIQPLIWKIKGIIQVMPALENIFLMILILITILFFNTKPNHLPIVFFCLSFVIILFILIGITTPAIGAITRYKTPALPFLCIGLLLLIDLGKLKKKIPFLSKWFN